MQKYKDKSLNIEERIDDLLSKMTNEEKVGQMLQVSYNTLSKEDYEKYKNLGIGSFLHVLGDEADDIKERAEKTRLGIPPIFGIDAIHGHCLLNGATVFPSQLAMSSSFNRKLIHDMGKATAKEVAADGLDWTFSPVLCIARDLRWGRVNETFGEDSYVIGELGKAIIEGYEEDNLIIACAKHYIAYGEATGGRDAYDSEVSERKIREVFLPPFEKAAKIRDEEKVLKEEVEKLKSSWKGTGSSSGLVVDEDDIADILADWTHIPAARLKEEEMERLKNLENILHARVIGQDEAVSAVAKAIKRGRAGLKDPKRPIGSFLFLGPTGVGKTELSKTLAEAMFGSENALIRVDMSEYMEKHAVSKFIGSPPGYVGFEEGGQLTEKIRKHPYSVILFDEIEKAHPDVFNIMLQILDDGILTDAQGRKVDFKNTVIIMTSNLGAKEILGNVSSKLGFKKDEEKDKNISEHDSIKNKVMEEVKRVFKPEFLNRIDDIIVFDRLTEDNIKEIAKLMLKSLEKRLNANEINVTFTESAVSKIAKSGFDPVYGARPLRRAIQNEIEDMLSEEIIDGNVKSGDSITVDVEDDKFTVKK